MGEDEGLEKRLEQVLGREELQARMVRIRRETGGILDDGAILALVADETGVQAPRLRGLECLSPDAPVTAACSVEDIEPARAFQSGGRQGRFRRIRVSDGGQSLVLMLWDEETDIIEQLGLHPGSKIRILSAVLKNTKYGPQIHVGRNGFIVLEEQPRMAGPPVLRDIKDLDEGNVIVKGVLLSLSWTGRGKNRTALGRLFDGTGEIDVLFSKNGAEILAEASVGVEIELSGARVEAKSGRKQLVCDDATLVRIL